MLILVENESERRSVSRTLDAIRHLLGESVEVRAVDADGRELEQAPIDATDKLQRLDRALRRALLVLPPVEA